MAFVLRTKIEAKFNKTIPIELIFQFPTVSLLAKFLENYDNSKNNSLDSIITPIQTEGSQSPFFWLHGGSVVPTIREHMGIDRPIYLLNHQSLDGKKAKYETIPEMVHYYIQAIMQIDSEGPYYLGGYSIGGMMIYEIAQQLVERGKKVALLFLLDPVGGNIDGTNNKSATKENLSLSLEYSKLKELGYITYFFSKINPLKRKLRDKVEETMIQAHFRVGKPLPTELIWPYQLSFYRQASSGYVPKYPLEGINKTILIQEKNSNPKLWSSIVKNNADIYFINSTHLELLEKPYSLEWIKILTETLSNPSS